MWKLQKEDFFYWPAKVTQPDNGSTTTASVMIKLRRLSHSEESKLQQQTSSVFADFNEDNKISKLSDISAYTDSIIDKVFLGWKDGEIKDADGTELTNNEQNHAMILDIPAFRAAILNAYNDSKNGVSAKTKN